MIDLAEMASRIPQCTWGVSRGRGFRFNESDLTSEAWKLGRILLVDARTLAADGHYRVALERCLMVRRVARHLGEDSDLELAARKPDLMALRTVQHVLSLMPPDVEIITWFRGQLALVQGMPLSLPRTLQANFKSYLYHMRTHPVLPARLRTLLVETAEDEQAKEDSRSLTDEQLLARAREGFAQFLDLIFRITDSEMTYEQECVQMQKLTDKLKEGDDGDRVVGFVMPVSGVDPMAGGNYPFQVGHQAHINATKAAVEVYLVLAKTGQLPEKVPDYLPKDPFTGRDLVYEITDDGFALRCQGEAFLSGKNRWLEFKVRE